jgi:NADPH:quinone reductase-like Zn-dependent oxidoreductase
VWKYGVVAVKPENVNFKEAKALPVGAMTAMYLLEKGGLKNGQKVLVYRASGSVDSDAVQLTKQQGAMGTGVCSGSIVEMVKSLGVEKVINSKTEGYSKHNEKYNSFLMPWAGPPKLRPKKS